MKLLIFVFCYILITIESSKCPESRKPHSTSCTIFYNCVNLPGGGYVWVPSKCTEGLIFQPYLRICVLPGDSWECDTLSTESSIITNRYDVPELINPNETSYMGLTEDPWNLSEFVDSSYTTDNIPDYQETATPYPLIEIAETVEHKHDLNVNNASEINKENSYLQTQSDNKKYYSMLNQLIHHLLLYKKITIPLEFLASSSSLSTSPGLVTNLPLTNYLVQNYIQQNNNLQNTIITDVKLQNTSENNVKDDITEPVSNENSKNSSVFDNMGNENNIILITDHVGNRQYLTIERYKSLGYRISDSQYVQLIPCIKSTRMPNITDCTRYYMCEPVTASVIEYSCPLFTAFNRFTKTCDTGSYNKCIENKNNADVNSPGSIDNIFETNVSNKNICMEHGKTKDPTSESHYYICYSSPDDSQIKSIRMTCPNGLIFCQVKKVCTTKQLCKLI